MARLRRRAGVLGACAIGLVLAATLPACAGDPDSASADSEQRVGASPATAAEVQVPDVVGMPADEAAAEIEASGDLVPSFDPAAADASACTVSSQDESGSAPPGTEVVLRISCQVDVPDVTGLDPDSAVSQIEAAGKVNARIDVAAADAELCVVTAQSEVGPVEERTVVLLSVEC